MDPLKSTISHGTPAPAGDAALSGSVPVAPDARLSAASVALLTAGQTLIYCRHGVTPDLRLTEVLTAHGQVQKSVQAFVRDLVPDLGLK